VAFAKSQGLQRIGIDFCVSLTKEAQKLGRLLRDQDFETELRIAHSTTIP